MTSRCMHPQGATFLGPTSFRFRATAAAVVGALAVSILPAQAVLNVGPSRALVDLPAAIAAASPGDVLVVDPGSYSAFRLDRALMIRPAATGTAVVVQGTAARSNVLFDLPAGTSSYVEGLRFEARVEVRAAAPLGVRPVLALHEISSTEGMTVDGVDTALHHSVLLGPRANVAPLSALRISGACTVAAVSSQFSGETVQAFFAFPPHGIELVSGAFHGASCVLRGGNTVWGHAGSVGQGLQVHDGQAWLVDSTLATNSMNPGVALFNNSARAVVMDGTAINGLVQGAVVQRPLLGVGSPTPAAGYTLGATVRLDFTTEPSLPVFVHGRLGLGPANATLPLLSQPEWGFNGVAASLAAVGASSSGVATFSIRIPVSGVFLNQTVWFQAWSAAQSPLELSPPVGGLIR